MDHSSVKWSQTDRQTNRQTDKQTDRQTDRHIDGDGWMEWMDGQTDGRTVG